MVGLSSAFSISAAGAVLSRGWQQVVSVPAPGAGVTTVGYTVPGQYWAMVLTARASLTTDATAGTRSPTFEVHDGDGTTLFAIEVSSGVAPSTTVNANVAVGSLYAPATSGESSMGWPRLVVPSGYTYHFHVNTVGPADAWTDGAVLYVALWPTDVTMELESAGAYA